MTRKNPKNPEQKIYEPPVTVRMSRGLKLELERLAEKYETNQSHLIRAGLKLLISRLKWSDKMLKSFTEAKPEQLINMLISQSVELYDQEEKKLTAAMEKFLGETLGEGSQNGLSANNQRGTDKK